MGSVKNIKQSIYLLRKKNCIRCVSSNLNVLADTFYRYVKLPDVVKYDKLIEQKKNIFNYDH